MFHKHRMAVFFFGWPQLTWITHCTTLIYNININVVVYYTLWRITGKHLTLQRKIGKQFTTLKNIGKHLFCEGKKVSI